MEGKSSLISDKQARAVEVLDKGLEFIPERNVPYDAYMVQYSQMYYQLDQPDKGFALDEKIAKVLMQEITWYNGLDREKREEAQGFVKQNAQMLQRMISSAKQNGKDVSEWEAFLGGGN